MSRVNYRLKLLEIAESLEGKIWENRDDPNLTIDELRTIRTEGILATAAAFEKWILRDVKADTPAADRGNSPVCRVIITDGEKRSYDVKDILKEMGLHWDAQKKAWVGNFTKEDAGAVITARELDGLSIRVEE